MRTIDEVYDWDQTASQGLLIDVEHATLGRTDGCPGPPLRFFAGRRGRRSPAATTRAPPALDEHGAAIRAWLQGSGPH